MCAGLLPVSARPTPSLAYHAAWVKGPATLDGQILSAHYLHSAQYRKAAIIC